MATVKERVQHSLDESRMLILGSQVLLGFEYRAAFEPAYERLSPAVQELKLVSLGLMLLAIGLLIAPGAFHRIVERGNDTTRLISFTTGIASAALAPFALGLGIDVYVASGTVLGPVWALPAGVAAATFAFIFWYALEWFWHQRTHPGDDHHKDQDMAEKPTDLDTRIKHVLTEARVVLPGVQALLGFQLASMLTDAFEKLPRTSQYVHLASLGLLAISMVFLMAPAAFHRIVEHGDDTERVHTFSSAMLLCAMVPLALGIAGDFYIVLDKVLHSSSIAMGLAGASVVVFFGLWFGVTLVVRARSTRTDEGQSVSLSRRAFR